MVPSGPTTPMGGAQSVTPSLMRSNSGMLGGQGGPVPSQGSYPSLVSPRTQFNNVNLLGNVPNVSSLLNQSFGSGGANPGLSGGLGNNQRVGMDVGAESDPLSGAGTGMGFNPSSSSLVPGNMVSPASSGQIQGQQFSNPSGNQMLPDQQSSQQLETQNFQHAQPQLQQFSAPLSNQPQQQQQQQQQYQSIRGGLGGVSSVKLEPPVTNDQNGSHQQQPQQLQALRSLGPVKLEPQQLQSMRNMGPVKMEPQHSDQSMFLHQQQQLIQQMSMSRQPSQAQLNLLQQQRLLQLQQHQQQHLLKAMPQQRAHVHQSFQPQNLPLRSPLKPVYEPGMCARRLTLYMCQQQQRPEDNNIDFWRKFVTEYFAPNAKKKWCVSMYGSGRQTTGVFPQDAWHCEICNRKPGRGFEATVEVLPRLFKIKYESGTLEELLYVDMPREYQNSSGQIVLDYAKAIQESVFEQLRVVRDGQLRIVFSPDLKIVSWEFCARRHEELIPRRLLIPQVTQLGTAAQKYQAATQNTSSNLSVSDLQSNCNMFVASARQLAKSLEVPLVNDLGYTKRYVRCLQISEVVKSMIDLIDYSRLTGTGPKESLEKFPRRTSSSAGFQGQNQQPEQQQQPQPMGQNPNNEQSPGQAAAMQLASSNGIGVNNSSLNTSSASASTTAIAGLLHQNSINSRLQNPMTNSTSPYGGGSISAQMPSPGGSSTTMQQTQPTPSPFQSPTPSSSHVPMAAPTTNHTNPSQDNDTSDSQSSVQKIIQEMMMSSQLNGGGGNPGMMGVGSLGNDVKNINGVSFPAGNGPPVGNPGLTTGGGGFGAMAGGGMGQSASMLNGIRAAAMGNNNPSGLMNGRVGISQQQDLGNQMMSGLGGAVNVFNNLQYEWKPSP